MRNVFVTSICDQLWHDSGNIFGCLDSSKKYLLNATFDTSLAYQMGVLERLEKPNFSKIRRFGPTLKIKHPVSILKWFFLDFWMVKTKLHCSSYIYMRRKNILGHGLAFLRPIIEKLAFYFGILKHSKFWNKMLTFQ